MSLRAVGWSQQHPTKTLTDPDDGPIEVDVEMVPLVEALWAAGYTTIMSCQDIGEAILTGGTVIPKHLWERNGAYYLGMAWLKIPADQGPRLMRVWEPLDRQRRGEWLAQVPIESGRLCGYASVHFPREQIARAADLLT